MATQLTEHEVSIRSWLRGFFVDTPFAQAVNLAGKQVVVTGASPCSLGYETARTLARWGAQVVVTSRGDVSAIVQALQEQLEAEGVAARVTGHPLDLCDAESVSEFARWYREHCGDRLDVLVNNAGVHLDLMAKWKEPRLSDDGHELQWRTNYLGTVQLTHELLPLLKQTGERHGDARVVNVGSQIHARARNEALFDANTSYNSWKFYGMSKLALIHFSNEFNRRYAEAHKLQSYCLHPGGVSGVYTGVADKGFANAPLVSFLRKLGAPIERLFMSTAEEGAQTQIYCATSPDATGGHYYVNCAIGQASEAAANQAAAQQLWDNTQLWLQSLDTTDVPTVR